MQAAIQPRSEPTAGCDLEQLFRQHHALVFRAAYRITGDPMDAEDVLQTVFVRLLRREQAPPLSADPRGYLHRAAVNAALDVQRSKRSRRATALDEMEPSLSSPASDLQDRRVSDREIRDEVRRAMGKLSAKSAEVFALRYFEGYGNNEIARMLGTSRSTVGVMLHRARQSLRRELGSGLAGFQENRHEQD